MKDTGNTAVLPTLGSFSHVDPGEFYPTMSNHRKKQLRGNFPFIFFHCSHPQKSPLSINFPLTLSKILDMHIKVLDHIPKSNYSGRLNCRHPENLPAASRTLGPGLPALPLQTPLRIQPFGESLQTNNCWLPQATIRPASWQIPLTSCKTVVKVFMSTVLFPKL